MNTVDYIFLGIIIALIFLKPDQGCRLNKKHLTPEERKLFKKLSHLKGDSLMAVSLREVCRYGLIEDFRRAIMDLKEQGSYLESRKKKNPLVRYFGKET